MEKILTNNKFRVGISGHRDLKEKNKDLYRAELKKLLKYFVGIHPNKEVLAVSPLADGADRLFIQVALELGLRYEVLLPMRAHIYQNDFNDTSYQEFNRMLLNAREYKVISMYNNTSEKDIIEYGYNRDLQYREVGRKLIETTEYMLFLWDGEESMKVGGTFDTLLHAKEKDVEYKIIHCERES